MSGDPQQAKDDTKEPISINADTLEYSTDSKNVTATGNVEVLYKGAKLTCQRLTINTETKYGEAQGNVRLDQKEGVIEAHRMIYNFEIKSGTMYDAEFRANPYFGKMQQMKKLNDIEFIGSRTQMSTCSFDHPHYRIKSRKVDFLRGERLSAKDNLFTVGQKFQVPLLYLPQFDRSLKKPYMHVQFSPGTRKEWGQYLLTAWRYNLTEKICGDVLLDYRNLLGIAEGFNLNYADVGFGKGEFKFYYTQERDKSKDLSSDVMVPKVFERYLARWRHKWQIDERTDLITEFYKIVDSKRMIHGNDFNFLREYFYREYEKDPQPISYFQITRTFLGNSSGNILLQPRVNNWYTQLEKFPEVAYNLPSSQVGSSPLYWENSSILENYNLRNAVGTISTTDSNETRFDFNNRLSWPAKIAFVQINPFVKNEATYYNKDVNYNHNLTRIIFSSGADLSTKFYRIFNIKTNFLGLDLNSIRHIITPTVAYTFQNTPTIPSSKLKQFDAVDAINGVTNKAVFGLQNKLQTKRNGSSVDLLDFRVDSSYQFKSSNNKSGGTLTDFLLYLDVLPYSWMALHSDATFSRNGNHFTQVNTDLNFNFGSERTLGIGNRYTRGSSKETVMELEWRLNPKWKVSVYERMQFGRGPNVGKGLREQQYTVSRDMHCWITELTWNTQKAQGESVWLIFRLKAFPELEFNMNQSYHAPKPGSQSPESPTN